MRVSVKYQLNNSPIPKASWVSSNLTVCPVWMLGKTFHDARWIWVSIAKGKQL